MSTYRERRLAKAERLREWADAREQSSAQLAESARAEVAMIPLGQPIHGTADRNRRERSWDRLGRAVETGRKGEEMAARAEEIERQAAHAIYDDDPDAVERLIEKIAALEAQRDARKQANAAYRREHRAELKGMSAYDRHNAVPFPSWSITNLTGNMGRCKERLARLTRERDHGPTDRIITARFDSECANCSAPLKQGEQIRYNRQQGARCMTCQEG